MYCDASAYIMEGETCNCAIELNRSRQPNTKTRKMSRRIKPVRGVKPVKGMFQSSIFPKGTLQKVRSHDNQEQHHILYIIQIVIIKAF